MGVDVLTSCCMCADAVEAGRELLIVRVTVTLIVVSFKWLRVDLHGPGVDPDLDWVYATYTACVRQEVLFQYELALAAHASAAAATLVDYTAAAAAAAAVGAEVSVAAVDAAPPADLPQPYPE